jgi:hypothetical protein
LQVGSHLGHRAAAQQLKDGHAGAGQQLQAQTGGVGRPGRQGRAEGRVLGGAAVALLGRASRRRAGARVRADMENCFFGGGGGGTHLEHGLHGPWVLAQPLTQLAQLLELLRLQGVAAGRACVGGGVGWGGGGESQVRGLDPRSRAAEDMGWTRDQGGRGHGLDPRSGQRGWPSLSAGMPPASSCHARERGGLQHNNHAANVSSPACPLPRTCKVLAAKGEGAPRHRLPQGDAGSAAHRQGGAGGGRCACTHTKQCLGEPMRVKREACDAVRPAPTLHQPAACEHCPGVTITPCRAAGLAQPPTCAVRARRSCLASWCLVRAVAALQLRAAGARHARRGRVRRACCRASSAAGRWDAAAAAVAAR